MLFLPEHRLKLFRSVRFNIYLFLVIAVASAAGTFLPMEQGSRLVYHSWWFAGLLALMAFDVIVCKLRRLPPENIRIEKAKLKNVFISAHNSEETVKRIKSWFEARQIKYEQKKHDGTIAFSGGKNRIQRWGDFILHVSIVAVLAGNLMGAIFGFEEVLAIPQGQTMPMKNRPYDVTLEHFQIDYYKGTNAPSVYASELVVRTRDKNQIVGKKRIVVNEPLDIDRVRFYQASWGMTYEFNSAKLHVAGGVLELKPKEITPIPGTPLAVRANMFLPSFALDAKGQPTTTDFEGKNPALQIDFLQKKEIQARVWLLKNDPSVAYRITDTGVTPAAPPPFFILDVDPILFSGIQVGYDPGAPLFWTSSIVLLIGLCTHFYLHQRRLQVLITTKNSKCEVTIGGWNSRSVEEFKTEFSEWVGGLRQALT